MQRVADQLEALRQSPLTEEERQEIDLWEKGRNLATIVGFPGWDVALEILRTVAAEEIKRLADLSPFSHTADERLAQQAITYGVTASVQEFERRVNEAVTASRQTPGSIKTGLRAASAVPPDSL